MKIAIKVQNDGKAGVVRKSSDTGFTKKQVDSYIEQACKLAYVELRKPAKKKAKKNTPS